VPKACNPAQHERKIRLIDYYYLDMRKGERGKGYTRYVTKLVVKLHECKLSILRL